MGVDETRISSAIISPCGRYRYRLVRRWQDGGSTCVWIMLNPSTADASVDDATIRKCVAFAKAWGHQAIEVVNLFAWRSTDPSDLPGAHAVAVGEENDEYIARAAIGCHAVVCGWGNRGADSHAGAGHLRRRDAEVLRFLDHPSVTVPLQCLGTNKNGTPKHPLYVAMKTALVPMVLP